MNNKNHIRFFLTPDGIVCYQGNDAEELEKLEELHRKVMTRDYERRKFLRSVPKIPRQTSQRRVGSNRITTYYLLGKEADGTKWWLESPEYNCCGWYTSFGHIVTFERNWSPEKARDIGRFTHVKEALLKEDIFNSYKMLLCGGVTLEDKEIWEILELFKEAYILEEYYEMMYTKGAHITRMPFEVESEVLNTQEMERIKKQALPAVLKRIRQILKGGE